MKRFLLPLAIAALYAVAPCAAQPIPEMSKSVQLSKVILDTELSVIKGKLKGGTLCVFPQEWKITKEKKTQDYERYDFLFSEKMKDLGFRVVTTSSDLFAGEEEKNKADFLIGAVIRPDTMNICSSVKGAKGDLTLAVDWQVFDRVAQKVVVTATTTGQAAQEIFAKDGLDMMWNKAFVASLGALIEQGVVQKYVGTPPPQPASSETTTADNGKL